MFGTTANEVHDLLSDRRTSWQALQRKPWTVIYNDQLAPARTNRDLADKALVCIGESDAHHCLKTLIANVSTLVKVDANP